MPSPVHSDAQFKRALPGNFCQAPKDAPDGRLQKAVLLGQTVVLFDRRVTVSRGPVFEAEIQPLIRIPERFVRLD